MRNLFRLMLGAALALTFATPRAADASLLGINLEDAPDILSQFIDVTYDSEIDSLLATGFSLQLKVEDGFFLTIENGGFDIDIITAGMGSASSGLSAPDDLLVTGSIDVDGDDMPDIMGVLLTGTVLSGRFGATETGPGIMDFEFEVTGGELAGVEEDEPLFLLGSTVGTILSLGENSSFTGSFDEDFDNLISGIEGSGAGTADTAPVPEPGSLLLLGSGALGLLWAGRRRS